MIKNYDVQKKQAFKRMKEEKDMERNHLARVNH